MPDQVRHDVGGGRKDQPTDPSSDMPSSFCASTANSIGSCCSTSRATPLTIRRSEEHTSELQSLMRISYAVFCLKKKKPRIMDTMSDPRPFRHRLVRSPRSQSSDCWTR